MFPKGGIPSNSAFIIIIIIISKDFVSLCGDMATPQTGSPVVFFLFLLHYSFQPQPGGVQGTQSRHYRDSHRFGVRGTNLPLGENYICEYPRVLVTFDAGVPPQKTQK